jgi:hypothetical protein
LEALPKPSDNLEKQSETEVLAEPLIREASTKAPGLDLDGVDVRRFHFQTDS